MDLVTYVQVISPDGQHSQAKKKKSQQAPPQIEAF